MSIPSLRLLVLLLSVSTCLADPTVHARRQSQQRSTGAPAASATPSSSQILFAQGAYGSGVVNWSWNLCNTQDRVLLAGASVLLFDECRGGDWGAGGYLHLGTPVAAAQQLQFDIYLGADPVNTARQIGLAFGSGTNGLSLSSVLVQPLANAWNPVRIDLTKQLNGLAFQDLMLMNASGHPKFYLNNVAVVSASSGGGGGGTAVTVSVDATADVHAISPLIYGVAAFDNTAATLSALNAPINRHGGNATSGYNWQIDASARGMDWFFESVPETSAGTPSLSLINLVSANRSAGAQSMITVPMMSYVARLGPQRGKLSSFSVAKYGPQQYTDAQWMPDAGNGVHLNGSLVSGNDPLDAHIRVDETFQQGLVQSLVTRFGNAAAGGVRYYLLDNEHSIWHSTHRDVHPQGAGMDEVLDAMRRHASVIRRADPGAQIVGPEEWGWGGYIYSGKDLQAGNWAAPPDRTAHGGMDYVPWLLKNLRAQEQVAGLKLLDVFSLHYYPQSGEYSNDVSAGMQKLRNESTRSLWDPSYKDKSWIADKVMLVPRMKTWMNQYAPGLKLALTEYSWGADGHINGATAQADVLGILGREGLDIATRWTAPAAGSPTFKAFQMYRNVDGQKRGFGETSVRAVVPNPDLLSAFAAKRGSDGALTVMVVNKDGVGHDLTLALAHFGSGAGTAQRWQLDKGNKINALSALSYSGGKLADKLPAQSITLYVIR